MEQPVEQRAVTRESFERTGAERLDTTEDTEETGSGNGGDFDRVSDHQDDDNDDDEGPITVMLDTLGPSHGFWPDDAQCSRHR